MKNKITKAVFIAALGKFKPSKFVKFVYKYFSKSSKPRDLWLKQSIVFTLLSTFLVGFIGSILKWPFVVIEITTLSYLAILSILVASMFIAVILNNRRIKRICEYLGIDKVEYDKLIKKYNIVL